MFYFRIFLPFFRKRKKKDAPERRKKARGKPERLVENSLKKHERILGTWNTAELLPQLPKALNQAKNG